MSMVYCPKCDRMIDLDYDSEHECFDKQTNLSQYAGKEFNHRLAGEKFQ